VIVLDGHSPDFVEDAETNVYVYVGIEYTLTIKGQHVETLLDGDAIAWDKDGDCEDALNGNVVYDIQTGDEEHILEDVTFATTGTFTLCIRASQEVETHAHITATSYHFPPSPPPPPTFDDNNIGGAVQEYSVDKDNTIAKYGAINGWDVSRVTDMKYLFLGKNTFNDDISDWDTSGVTDMTGMFWAASAFNQQLSFDTSSVTNMMGMFQGASAFNQELSFDTSSVTSMTSMLQGASAFNQQLSFDTSNVASMTSMLQRASAFNQQLSFDTSNVASMTSMLQSASAFNQELSFDTSSVTDMARMFEVASAFNQQLSFDTSSVTNTEGMFQGAASFDQPLNSFDTSNVVNMARMFQGASVFDQELNNWDTSRVTSMQNMFYMASMFNQPLYNWDTSNVVSMGSMFAWASYFNNGISGWDTSSVTDMDDMFNSATDFSKPIMFDISSLSSDPDLSSMFHRSAMGSSSCSYVSSEYISCSVEPSPPSPPPSPPPPSPPPPHSFTERTALLDAVWDYHCEGNYNSLYCPTEEADNQVTATDTYGPINHWDVSEITDMTNLFAGMESFNGEISGWDTSSVTTMEGTFKSSLDLNGVDWVGTSFNQPLDWDVSSVTSMERMFQGATSFNQPLDWDVSSVTTFDYMFDGANGFNKPVNDWDVSSVTSMAEMFKMATSFNQPLGPDPLSSNDGWDTGSGWNTASVTNMTQMFYGASAFDSALSLNMSNLEKEGSTKMWTGPEGSLYSSGSKFIRSRPALDDAVQLWYKDKIDEALNPTNTYRRAEWAYGYDAKERIDKWDSIADGIGTNLDQEDRNAYEHILNPRCGLKLQLSGWDETFDADDHNVNGIYRMAGFPNQPDTFNGQPYWIGPPYGVPGGNPAYDGKHYTIHFSTSNKWIIKHSERTPQSTGKIDDGTWHVFRSSVLSSATPTCPESLARSEWETNTGSGGFYVGSIDTLA